MTRVRGPVKPSDLAQSAIAFRSAICRWLRVAAAGRAPTRLPALMAPAATMLTDAATTAAIPTARRSDADLVLSEVVMAAGDRAGLNGHPPPPLTCTFRSLSSL